MGFAASPPCDATPRPPRESFPRDRPFAAGSLISCLLFLSTQSLSGCKRADTEAADGDATTAADASRAHPTLLAARADVRALASLNAPLEIAARLCEARGGDASPASGARAASCFVDRMGSGLEAPDAVAACRAEPRAPLGSPSPACVARFEATATNLGAKGFSFSRAQIEALCAGVSVPGRPQACVDAFAGTAPDAFVACRGNDDPGAPGCFLEARSLVAPFVVGKPAAKLPEPLAARLCGRPE